jgi:uncharacterized membrane protein YdjX (TVP38/TMEM64 family)
MILKQFFMPNFKRSLLFFSAVCGVSTIVVAHLFGGLDQAKLQTLVKDAGVWAPIVYIALYVVATSLLMPSTALNLTGGALFGPFWGLVWTSVGAVLAAVVSFIFTRTVGHEFISHKFARRWPTMDAEVKRGGLLYIFAIRLLPIFPYGLVNYVSGLTSISFRHYLLGTIPGTIMGVLPFVLIGSSGLKAIHTGDVLPFLGALALTGLLVAGAAWYRNRKFNLKDEEVEVNEAPL